MIFVLLLCLLIGAGLLLAYRLHMREARGHPLPPSMPFRLPIIGHTHMLLGDNKDIWELARWAALYTNKTGGVTVAYIGRNIYYLITDPDDALTAANACLDKHFAYSFVKNWLGNGLITGSGEIWKRHRKLMTPAFSLPVIHGFLGIFNSQAKKFVKQLEPLSGKGPVDIFKTLRHISLESFCLTSFGIAGCDKDFVDKYLKAADYILMLGTSRFYRIYLQNDLIYKLSGLQKKETAAIKVLKTMSAEVIQRKKATMENERKTENGSETNNGKYKAMLDLMLSMEDRLTDEEIREEIDTAISAGFDTTSILIVYTTILLGSYTDVQEKLYEEFIKVLGPDRDVEKDDLNKLVYTEAVLKESLRFITEVPALPRYVDEDVKLKNYTMRAGSQCLILPAGTHRHKLWGQDCELFRPERWLDGSPIPANCFGGFSWGKRSCLGKTYALATMKVTLSHFLRRYRVKADVSQLELKLDFILKPASGYEVSLEKRN